MRISDWSSDVCSSDLLGIPVLADRTGVGGNLQNHQVVYIVAQLRRGAAQPESLKSHSIAALRYSSGAADCPPLDMSISISSKTGWHALGRRLAALVPTVLKPASRGRVSLIDRDTATGPLIEFDYLSDDRDRIRLVDGVRRSVGMLMAPELRPLWHNAFPVSRTHKMRHLNDTTPANPSRPRILAALFEAVPAQGRPPPAPLPAP